MRGGSTRLVTDLVGGLRAAGHTVDVLTYDTGPVAYFWNVRRHARSSDVVHAIDLNPRGFIGYLATRFTRAKFVITVIGTYAVAPLYSRKTKLFARIVYRAADAIASISSFTKSEIEKEVRGLRITVITPGIDLANFEGDPGSAARPPYILSVGSIKRRKGYDVALQAFIRVKKEIPDLRYVIVGAQIDEPQYVQMLMRMAEDSGVSESVDFIEGISDARLKELYRNASLFILTSVNEGLHFEGFGIVFLEAAAYGLPSIGTRGNGIEDATEDGKTALLVPQRDVEATATAIRKLLTDQPLADRMSLRAREFAREHDQSSIVIKHEKLYRSVLLA